MIDEKYKRKKSSLVSIRVLKKVVETISQDEITQFKLSGPGLSPNLACVALEALEFSRNDFDLKKVEDRLVRDTLIVQLLQIVENRKLTTDEIVARNAIQCITEYDETPFEKRSSKHLMGLYFRCFQEKYNELYRTTTNLWTGSLMSYLKRIREHLKDQSEEYVRWCFEYKEPTTVGLISLVDMMNEFLGHKIINAKKSSTISEFDGRFLEFIQKNSSLQIKKKKDLDWLLAIEQSKDIFEEDEVRIILSEARKQGIISELKEAPHKWPDDKRQAFMRGEYA